MAIAEQLSRLASGVDAWNQWRSQNVIIGIDLCNADLRELNLSGVDLSCANLRQANLAGVNLTEANLIEADCRNANLRRADLGHINGSRADFSGATLHSANLTKAELTAADFTEATLIEANLMDADLSEVNGFATDFSFACLANAFLSDAHLYRANFYSASLINTDLSHANLGQANLNNAMLVDADLSHANLAAAQALNANCQQVDLTGACIEDWHINPDTQFQSVVCSHVFFRCVKTEDIERWVYQDRRPADPERCFAEGEFVALVQTSLSTIDLIFSDGIDWQAFLISFEQLQVMYQDEALEIQAIERKGHTFIIRLATVPSVETALLEREARSLYTQALQQMEAQYRAELQAKDREIEIHRKQSANMTEITRLLASRTINVEAMAVSENNSSNHSSDQFNNDLRGAKIANFANQVNDQGRQQAKQYNTEAHQSLAEAADEIQTLLQQLEQSNPDATEQQQQAYLNAAISPSIKQRAISAFKSGGEAAIGEFLENPYAKVGVAVVKGWVEAEVEE